MDYELKNIVTVSSAAFAINKIQDNKYDLIISEYNLGSGKNGKDLLEYITHHNLITPDVDFIITSSDATEAVVLSTLEASPDGYLMKPFSAKDMQSKLLKIKKEKSVFIEINKFLRSEQIELALLECEKTILKHPDYMSKILKQKSDILLSENRLEEAYLLYRTLIYSNPDNLGIGVQYANILIKLEKYDSAEEILNRVLVKNKRLLEAYDLKEKIAIAKKDNKKQQQILESVSKISPLSVKRQKNLAELAESNGDFNIAYRAYKYIIKHQKHSLHYSNNLKLKWIEVQSQKALSEGDQKNIDIALDNLKMYTQEHSASHTPLEMQTIFLISLELITYSVNHKTLQSLDQLYSEHKCFLLRNKQIQITVLKILRESEYNNLCDYWLSKMPNEIKVSSAVRSILSSYQGNKKSSNGGSL
jgi:tetratricopeptide (TPR) repeat protein